MNHIEAAPVTWGKGVSGNPNGKPLGTISRTVKLRNMIADRIPEIIDTVINAAIAGDIQAARLLIERVLPAVKSESIPVNLDIQGKSNLAEIGETVINAIGAGTISVEHGASILSGLASHAKIIEITNLEQRIAALEQTNIKA